MLSVSSRWLDACGHGGGGCQRCGQNQPLGLLASAASAGALDGEYDGIAALGEHFPQGDGDPGVAGLQDLTQAAGRAQRTQ